jgi:hypothetical protein
VRRVGPYELQDVLGQGGMGTVFRARHVELGVVRALKVLLARRGASGEQAAARFARETEALAHVRHPNVVSIHESGVDPQDGSPWFAMDLVQGEPLEAVIARGPLGLERALELLVGVCRGVDALHERGVVHRDLKPQNVIVAADGRPVVIDLGLAVAPERDERLTKTGTLVGTPRYMAPEQVEGRGVSPRTDVHALGLLLYEVVTGEVALGDGSTSVHQVVGAILGRHRPVPSDRAPDLPVRLDHVCARARARDPARRYARAGELALALEEVRARPGPSRRARRRRSGAVFGALSVVALAVIAAAVVGARRTPAADVAEVTTEVAPSAQQARLEREDVAARRELEQVRRARPPAKQAEAAAAWLAKWPEHAGVLEARALRRIAQRGQALQVFDHEARGPAFGAFVGDDGRQVLTTAQDRTLRLWSLDDGERWVEARRWDTGGGVHTFARSADRLRVAASVDSGLVRHLEPLTPSSRVHDLVFMPELTVLAFGPSGEVLAGALRDPRDGLHRVRLIDRPGKRMTEELGGTRSQARALAFTRSGLLLVACGEPFRGKPPFETEHSLVAWDVATGEERWRLASWAEMACLTVSPDERLVAAGASSGQVHLVDLAGPAAGHRQLVSGVRGEGLLQQEVAHADGVKVVAFSPDGARLYTVASDETAELRVWSVADGRELRAPVACPVPGTTLEVSPDGATVLLSTRAGRVELWSADVD